MFVEDTQKFLFVDGLLEFLSALGVGGMGVMPLDAGDVLQATFQAE